MVPQALRSGKNIPRNAAHRATTMSHNKKGAPRGRALFNRERSEV
jgi:hypothetical protein